MIKKIIKWLRLRKVKKAAAEHQERQNKIDQLFNKKRL